MVLRHASMNKLFVITQDLTTISSHEGTKRTKDDKKSFLFWVLTQGQMPSLCLRGFV